MTLDPDKSNWKRVTLGEVIRHVTDRVDPETSGLERFLAGEHIPSNSLEIREWGLIGQDPVGPMFYKRFQPGHVLYVSRRAYLRKTAVPRFTGICGEKTFVLETVNQSVLLQRFLPFLMSADRFHQYAIMMSRGSVNPYINWMDIAAYEFDLPPLDEQKHIADVFWGIERHSRSLGRELRSLGFVLEAKISDWWGQFPKIPIASIGTCITGSTPGKAVAEFWSTPDVPFFTPSEIEGEVVSSPRQFVSIVGAASGRMLPVNSVMVACIGGEMGKCTVLNRPGISNQQITSVTGLNGDDAMLLQSLLSHSRGRAAMEARETTTIVRKLNKSDLMKVEVPWPEDRSVMRRVVSTHSSARLSLTSELDALQGVMAGLSAQIFRREI